MKEEYKKMAVKLGCHDESGHGHIHQVEAEGHSSRVPQSPTYVLFDNKRTLVQIHEYIP